MISIPSSGVTSLRRLMTPALLIRTCSGVPEDRKVRDASRTDANDVRSSRRNRNRPFPFPLQLPPLLSGSMVRIASDARVSERHPSITVAPRWYSCRDVSSPMPALLLCVFHPSKEEGSDA